MYAFFVFLYLYIGFLMCMQAALNDVSRVFEERFQAIHQHLLTVSAVVAEVAEDVAALKGK